MSSPIEDYALIGDCLTAALVAKNGSIDWLCFPRFDSPACFASLLGGDDNGRWQIAPKGEIRSIQRRYRGDTLVLETEYTTDQGKVRLIDFMPPRGEAPDVVRIVEGVEGTVEMAMDLVFRFDYGSIVPWVHHRDDGLTAIAGPDMVHLVSPIPLHGEHFTTTCDFKVEPGQRIPFVLTWYPSYNVEPDPVHPEDALQVTLDFWNEWAGKCTYDGPHRDEVMRSLLTLKALIYEPTGGIVAAPTTSLPEKLGGVRNWDYRYCWVRDSTFSLYALANAGYLDEAKAWRLWLHRAVAGTPETLQIMYGLDGQRRLPEAELPWLRGYEGSLPVRIGNEAASQFQLDVYGELAMTMYECRRAGLEESDEGWDVALKLFERLGSLWREPDEGIWEVRGERRHFTHSKMMAWVAFDRAVKSVEEFGLEGPADQWRATRDEIHAEVCREGFNAEKNAFVQYYGADQLDASLLMMCLVGFLPASDPRVKGTIEAIERELTNKDGFVDRYIPVENLDGLPPGEGKFLLCSFWLIDNLYALGRKDDARRLLDTKLALRNDVGLLSEMFDPDTRRLIGNFPQAFSHLGLIHSIFTVHEHHGPTDGEPKC